MSFRDVRIFSAYQLVVVWHGQQNLIDDPYRFGPLIQKWMPGYYLKVLTYVRMKP